MAISSTSLKGPVPQLPLWRVPFLGGVPKRILDGVWSPVGWSPDGRQMAFIRLTAQGSSVIVADAEGTHERVVSSRRSPSRFYAVVSSVDRTAPAWSPDGRRIAVRGTEPDSQESPVEQIVVIDAVTGCGPGDFAAAKRGTAGSHAWTTRRSSPRLRIACGACPCRRASCPGSRTTCCTTGTSVLRKTAARSVTARADRRAAVWVGDAAGSSGTDVVGGRGWRCRRRKPTALYEPGQHRAIMLVPVRGRGNLAVAPDPRRTLTAR